MLTRRTNILLSEPDYLTLSQLASQKGKTIGELIRQAIRKTYSPKHSRREPQAMETVTQKGWKLLKDPQKPLNYRELIEHGRKY